jgi:hypothetical protein
MKLAIASNSDIVKNSIIADSNENVSTASTTNPGDTICDTIADISASSHDSGSDSSGITALAPIAPTLDALRGFVEAAVVKTVTPLKVDLQVLAIDNAELASRNEGLASRNKELMSQLAALENLTNVTSESSTKDNVNDIVHSLITPRLDAMETWVAEMCVRLSVVGGSTAKTLPVRDGISQVELARRLGVSEGLISHNKTTKTLLDFAEWTKAKDPHGQAWCYNRSAKLFQVISQFAAALQQADAPQFAD